MIRYPVSARRRASPTVTSRGGWGLVGRCWVIYWLSRARETSDSPDSLRLVRPGHFAAMNGALENLVREECALQAGGPDRYTQRIEHLLGVHGLDLVDGHATQLIGKDARRCLADRAAPPIEG